MNCPVIYGLQYHDKPKDEASGTIYPYIGYSIVSQTRTANIEYEEDYDADDIVEVWAQQFNLILSVNAVDVEVFAVNELATHILNWFSDVGEDFLTDQSIIYVGATPIIARDMFIVNDYERRQGFDLTLRVGREARSIKPKINTVTTPEGNYII